MKPFLFVVGSPRSGSTLLRAMINSHPTIAIPPESHFLISLINNQAFGSSCDDHILEHILKKLALNPRFIRWQLSPKQVLDSISVSPVTLADAIRCIYLAYARVHGKFRYGDKTPGYALNVPLLAKTFPESVFVHLVRDGRDVVTSLQSAPFGPNGIEQCAEFWLKRVQAAHQAGSHLNNRYLMIRYEDFVQSPDQQLRAICKLASLEYDPAMLNYQKDIQSIIAATAIPEIHTKLHQPLHLARDWRHELSSNDVNRIEVIAGRMLCALGYNVRRQ